MIWISWQKRLKELVMCLWQCKKCFWLFPFSRVSYLWCCAAAWHTLESDANSFCMWNLHKLLPLFSALQKMYRLLSVEMIGYNKSRLYKVVFQKVLFFSCFTISVLHNMFRMSEALVYYIESEYCTKGKTKQNRSSLIVEVWSSGQHSGAVENLARKVTNSGDTGLG